MLIFFSMKTFLDEGGNVSDESRESPDLIVDTSSLKSKSNEKDSTTTSKQLEEQESISLRLSENIAEEVELNIDISPAKSSLQVTTTETTASELVESGAAGIACGEYENLYTAVAVVPLTWCEHLELIKNKIYDPAYIDAYKSCVKCADNSENWLCLTCSQIFCSRFVQGHVEVEQQNKIIVLNKKDRDK